MEVPMADQDKRKPVPKPSPGEREKAREGQRHDEEVEQTFPASDPPSGSEPGGGITGPGAPSRERSKHR